MNTMDNTTVIPIYVEVRLEVPNQPDTDDAQLRAENARLRAENARLRAENADLRLRADQAKEPVSTDGGATTSERETPTLPTPPVSTSRHDAKQKLAALFRNIRRRQEESDDLMAKVIEDRMKQKVSMKALNEQLAELKTETPFSS